jgi:hypothetical protein
MSSDPIVEFVPDHLDPDKWAAMLGLVESSLTIHDETQRGLLFDQKFYHNTKIHMASGEVAQNIQINLWAAFTAKYLPALVDRILDLPPQGVRSVAYGADDYPLHNIYHTTFKFTDTAYLGKFMSSSCPIAEGGKRLPKVMAERLVKLAPNWLRRHPTQPMGPPISPRSRKHQRHASTLVGHLGCI